MTLDEAIEKEKKIAEENQKIVDTQIVFDDVSISELYCDDTEVIEEHLSNYKKCAEYHDQLAEWLEELKSYRTSVFSGDMTQKMLKDEYYKAIDDFTEKIIRYVDCGRLCYPTEIRWSDLAVVEMVKKLAEQLKTGDGE